MKNMLITLSCAGFFTVSCGSKDDDKSSGPGVEQPGIGLVAPADFKNTAKNGQEVSAKLREAGTANASVHFSKTGTANSDRDTNSAATQTNVLLSPRVLAFLGGDSNREFPSPIEDGPRNGGFNLSENSSCDSELRSLDNVYAATASGLTAAATALEQLDAKDLPEGVTRAPANPQFAVSYSIDLSKVNVETTSPTPDSKESRHLVFMNDHSRDSRHSSGSVSSDVKLTGLAMIGAAANDTMAVLSIGLNAVATKPDSSQASMKGGFAVSADNRKKLLQLSATADINAQEKDESGQVANAHASLSTKLDLQAGAKPSVALTLDGKSNLQPANGTTTQMTLTGEDHSVSAVIKIERLANADVAVNYALTVDAKKTETKVVLTNDASNRCVVKSTTAAPQPTTLKLSAVTK